jgi:AraC family transcriptional regulator
MHRGQPSTISKDLQQIIAPTCIRSSRDAGWQGFALASLLQPAYEQEMKGFPGCVLALHRRSNNPRFKPHHVSRLENSRHEGALMGGDMMIIPPHQPCFGVSDKPLACIAFTLDETYLQSVAERDGNLSAHHVEVRPVAHTFDAMLEHLLLTLDMELERGCPNGSLFAETVVSSITIHVLRSYGVFRPRPASECFFSLQMLKRVTGYVDEHLAEDIRLADLAHLAGLSPFHFARSFRRATGTSPHQFVIGRRLEKARHLLLIGRMTLTQVAYECGFADQSHLTRHFKRAFGVTPNQFRPQMKTSYPDGSPGTP